MNPPRIFRCPRDVVWGRGSLAHLEKIDRKRVLIVTDQVMTDLGVTSRAAEFLRQGGSEAKVFDAVEPEPSIATVRQILRQYGDFAPQVILGIGGGSAIDASKAFRIFFEHPHLQFEDVRYLESPPRSSIPPFQKTMHVAIPSTSGTGSEASYACIITDPALGTKCPILNAELIPDMAIIDPDLADSMPPAGLGRFRVGCAHARCGVLRKSPGQRFFPGPFSAGDHLDHAVSPFGLSRKRSRRQRAHALRRDHRGDGFFKQRQRYMPRHCR